MDNYKTFLALASPRAPSTEKEALNKYRIKKEDEEPSSPADKLDTAEMADRRLEAEMRSINQKSSRTPQKAKADPLSKYRIQAEENSSSAREEEREPDFEG